MYLLDTNVCMDFLHGRLPYAYDLMRRSDARLFKIPAIVEAELYLGVRKGKDRRQKRWLVDEFMLPFEVVPFTSECARIYADIRARLEEKGKPIGPNDLVIAATALAHSAVLVTNDVKEFECVPGLTLESWREMAWEEFDMDNPDGEGPDENR